MMDGFELVCEYCHSCAMATVSTVVEISCECGAINYTVDIISDDREIMTNRSDSGQSMEGLL